MLLQDAVARAFSADGALARCVDEFSPRCGQTHMAQAVAATMETGGVLVVEAGTGVGKTFAYLVPALLSGERVLLSTATKTLQDQLFGRDIPRLVKALGMPVVPIAMDSGRLWPRNAFIRRSGVVTFRLGEPIPPGLPRAEIEARVHAAINLLNS